MNLEKVLHYITFNSETLIQWIFFVILVLTAMLIGRGLSLFSKKKGEEALAMGGGVPADLQAALTTIMDRTSKLEAIPLAEASPALIQKVNAEVDALKKTLQSKDVEITQLKGSGNADQAATELKGRISELEAKLAEYEILEDDIADLSLYKDENAKLKREIEKFKAGGAGAASSPANAGQAAADDIVAEFAQAVVETPASAAPTAVAADVPNTGDPMADFENSLKSLSTEAAAPAPEAVPAPAEPAPTPAPAPAAAPAPEPVEPTLPNEKDDLFAEFAMTEATAEGEAGAPGVDADKMLSEVANLAPGEGAGNALEESVDTDKMVVEATGLDTKS